MQLWLDFFSEQLSCVGIDNKVSGEGFVMLGLDGMVVDKIWSKRTSSDGLGDPIFSPKVSLGQQGHSQLRSLVLQIGARPRHWHLQHSCP